MYEQNPPPKQVRDINDPFPALITHLFDHFIKFLVLIGFVHAPQNLKNMSTKDDALNFYAIEKFQDFIPFF